MNLTAPASFSEFIVPEWLQECLSTHHLASDCSEVQTGRADADVICRAFEFAYRLHQGQYRASGEPYIMHPVAVAGLLRDLGGGSAMIAAGFLHDVVEDTDITSDELEAQFGKEVRLLVEGVTKLSKFNFSSKTERQAENFRRMFLAMAQDIRVIVVKLADRLHNMRTLEHLSDAKRCQIALETREIFAPLANRLGIGRLKWELEDLSFKYLEPEAYRSIQELVAEKRIDRETQLNELANNLRDRLHQVGIQVFDLSGRPKHLYGIYQKMQVQQKNYDEIYDVAAVRIIVEANEDCYRALAIVHDMFRPIPGRFKDYIGLPKPNRYQSLHTVVVGTTGRPLEVQIRTLEMHHIAEYGIAAHWKYKEAGNSNGTMTGTDEKFTWLRQLLDWQSDLKDAQEYLESIKDDLFDGEVYVFTPQGDVVSLGRGSTAVDFAYRIHTEVGNHCAGTRINGRMMTLDTPLKNGDIVEILTNKSSHPSLDWLNFVVTTSARNRIRQWYKRSHRDENLARGREMLERELGKNGFEALLKSAPMLATVERCNYHSVDDLLSAVGYGEITLNHVVNRLRETVKAQQPIAAAPQLLLPSTTSKALPSPCKSPIIGVEGLLYHLAGCCTPVPGEPIIGVVTRSNRGISIHRQGCSNVEQVPGDRLVPVSWNPIQEGERPQAYPIDIQITVIDRVGVLKDILSRLTDNNINVRNAQVRTFPDQTAVIDLGIDVRNHDQLERTFAQVKKLSDVLNLHRLSQSED
ncbi:MAG: (p)ppGpp synthetase [Leptolyngbya sp.]|nr:MAG: (p)ppGpp synthetase [Leptolyngbya sp.]